MTCALQSDPAIRKVFESNEAEDGLQQALMIDHIKTVT